MDMKKAYICPAVLLVDIDEENILAGTQVNSDEIPFNPDPGNWVDAKGGYTGFDDDELPDAED